MPELRRLVPAYGLATVINAPILSRSFYFDPVERHFEVQRFVLKVLDDAAAVELPFELFGQIKDPNRSIRR